MTLEELINRELKVYFHANQKRTRKKETVKISWDSDPAAFTAIKDLMENKKDFV